ncbi:hypothetical protein SLE2022_396840 [Rubroshorea leprosula]
MLTSQNQYSSWVSIGKNQNKKIRRSLLGALLSNLRLRENLKRGIKRDSRRRRLEGENCGEGREEEIVVPAKKEEDISVFCNDLNREEIRAFMLKIFKNQIYPYK